MPDTFSKPLTQLLGNWEKGDKDAINEILPFVYDELRRVAHRCLQRERPNHTIQSTALVHEAYLRLAKQRPRHFEDRNHFIALAAQLMRYIVVDYARNHGALKRGAGAFKLELDDRLALPDKQVDLLALDDALKIAGSRCTTKPAGGAQVLWRAVDRRGVGCPRSFSGYAEATVDNSKSLPISANAALRLLPGEAGTLGTSSQNS